MFDEEKEVFTEPMLRSACILAAAVFSFTLTLSAHALDTYDALHRSIILDAKGIPISGNPVWDACIRGLPLTADFMKTNQDVVIHRQRRIRKTKPLSCRDYHRGDIRVWDYPGHPGVTLVLDSRGRMLGDPPTDFVIKKGFSASQ